MPRRTDLVLASFVVTILVCYALEKAGNGRWGELLYGCHVSSALLAIGLFAGKRKLVAIGLVFHVAVGTPSWLVWTITNGTRPMEIAAHVVPICAALPTIVREGFPRGIAPWAWGMFVAAQQAALWLTDPVLNVNVAHAPTPAIAAFVSTPMAARLSVLAAALVTLFVADAVLARTLRPRTT